MKKTELEDLVAYFSAFIRGVYASAGLPLPEEGSEWDQEEEVMLVYNAIKKIGRQEAIAALLLAEKDQREKEKLVSLIEDNNL